MADEREAPAEAGTVKHPESHEKGWFGTRKSQHPDSDYALTTGTRSPDGPDGPE